jgi:hypothetical protein
MRSVPRRRGVDEVARVRGRRRQENRARDEGGGIAGNSLSAGDVASKSLYYLTATHSLMIWMIVQPECSMNLLDIIACRAHP